MSETGFDLNDIAEWGVLFPNGGSDIYGHVYSGTFSVHDGSKVDDVTPGRIARVDASCVEHGDYAETGVGLLVELTDGSWATCMASCDTTGWDCQASAQWKWSRTRDEAISHGLDQYWRERLGVALPDSAPPGSPAPVERGPAHGPPPGLS